jgi:dTDP-4-amino-4,6-dideoxygalactose transaminase
MTRSARLYLSPPDVGEQEVDSVVGALESGWVAPLGPDVDAFEAELAETSGRSHAVALSSGTAALHMGLLALGVQADSEVLLPTLTFGATAFAVTYTGARPVFLDVEEVSWNLDPDVLEACLRERAAIGRLPSAVVTVDVFGRTADYDRILPLCAEYDVPVLCDSAEALGATYRDTPAGGQGLAAVFSFNGNKIITTSGGGALVTNSVEVTEQVRKLSNQSREPFPWYEHEQIGFNYRMSNILAALGRAQLARLPSIIRRRRALRDLYADELNGLPGVTVMSDPPWGTWNGWLTTVRMNADTYPGAPTKIRERLEGVNIEARPIWKPMHQQPVFRTAQSIVTGVADRLYAEGLCLPSGTAMRGEDVQEVCEIVAEVLVP